MPRRRQLSSRMKEELLSKTALSECQKLRDTDPLGDDRKTKEKFE